MKKRNQISLGIIILLIALIVSVKPDTGISVGALMCLVCAFAFLLLYRTKRKSWSLVAGGYLAYIGIAAAVTPVLPEDSSVNITAAMFFIVPALLFFVLYFDKNKRALLVPASLLLWFGVFLLVVPFVSFSGGGLFFMCMSSAFLMMYLIGRDYIGRWAICFAVAMAVLALVLLLIPGSVGGAMALLPRLLSIALILVSAALIVCAMRKR